MCGGFHLKTTTYLPKEQKEGTTNNTKCVLEKGIKVRDMTQRLPLNISHYDDRTIVTFLTYKGGNSVETLFKYLVEEFPLAPAVELLKVIRPDIEQFLDDSTTFLEERESNDAVLVSREIDADVWERIDDFRTSYRRWRKEISTSRYV